MFYLLLSILLISATGASAEGATSDAIPLESLKDALRQVFRIPDKVPTSPHRPSGRSLRFMMQLYKKITSGESQFPKEANTVRSIAPTEDSEQRHSLLFNLTTSQDERIISSYLHITGHRRPTHPSRIAFYLEPPSAEAGEEPPNTKELKDEPMMVVFVKKQPLDIDASRITKKALEYNPPLLIRILEEQLRRGKWVASPTRRLTKKSPILIVVSADPHILDIEAFGVGALRLGRTQRKKDLLDNKYKNVDLDHELSTHEKLGGSLLEAGFRSKRSLRGKNSFEFDGNKFPPLERGRNFITETEIKPQGKSPKDTYWIQQQTLDTDVPVEDENIFLNEFDTKTKFDYDIYSPLLTNSFSNGVEPYQTKQIQNVTSKTMFGNFKQKTSVQNKEEKQLLKTKEKESVLKSEIKAKSNMESHPATNDDFGDGDDESHLLLPPLKDYKPLPKSERKRLKKKNKKKSDLIPYPDYYASWDNWDWDYQESPSWKRKNRKGKKNKRVKDRKAKRISDKWISSGMQNQLSNAAAPVYEPFNGKCQKHSYYVDFRILGWEDFLVAPPGFETFFCSGGCPTPLTSIEAGSNHAIIQSLLRASNLSPELPNPCCVPARLDSLSIIMIEEDGRVALKTLPNMVVKSCSCQ